MTLEFDYLVASIKKWFRSDATAPSGEGLNWNRVLELADNHSVRGFLYESCQYPEAREGALEAARYSLLLSAQLANIADLFEKNKMGMVPLKGPVLAAELYQGKGVKTSTDLDVLVHCEDALRAKQLLEAAGYRLTTVPHWPVAKAYLRNVNDQLSFTDPACSLKLDLHWKLLPGYFPSPFDDAELWARLRTVAWGRTRLETLSPEYQLMFLCAHGTRHLWARLGWLCDLARLVQIEQGMNWSEVFDRADRSGTTRMILLSLSLASKLCGVDLPEQAARLAGRDAQVPKLVAIVMERLRADRPAPTLATANFCMKALERPRHRVRILLALLQPTEAEYRVLQMPPSLYWAYYAFRPLRLAAKYSRRRTINDPHAPE